jgi:hypothetical protein
VIEKDLQTYSWASVHADETIASLCKVLFLNVVGFDGGGVVVDRNRRGGSCKGECQADESCSVELHDGRVWDCGDWEVTVVKESL